MNIVSGIKSIGESSYLFLEGANRTLFIGRLTDFDVDLKVVHQIEVCLWGKLARVNFWIASVRVKVS